MIVARLATLPYIESYWKKTDRFKTESSTRGRKRVMTVVTGYLYIPNFT